MSFICPITLQDHKTALKEGLLYCKTDGHIYQRKALETWLSKDPRSPMTKEPVKLTDCIDITNFICPFTNKSADALECVMVSEIDGSLMEKSDAKLWFETNSKHPDTLQIYPNGIHHLLPVYNGNTEKIPKPMKDRVAPFEHSDAVNVIAVLDESGSMGISNSTKTEEDEQHMAIDLAQAATIAAFGQIASFPKDFNLKVFGFNDMVHLIFSQARLTSINVKVLKERMDQSYHPDGTTNLHAAIVDPLELHIRECNANPFMVAQDTVLLVFTDGRPQCGPPWPSTLRLVKHFLDTKWPQEMKIPTLIALGLGHDIDALSLSKLVEIFREKKRQRGEATPYNQGAFAYINEIGDLNKVIPAFIANFTTPLPVEATSTPSQEFEDYKVLISDIHTTLFPPTATGERLPLTYQRLMKVLEMIEIFEKKDVKFDTELVEIKKALVGDYIENNEKVALEFAKKKLKQWGEAYITWVYSTLKGGLPWSTPEYMPSTTILSKDILGYDEHLMNREFAFTKFVLPPPKPRGPLFLYHNRGISRQTTSCDQVVPSSMPRRAATIGSYGAGDCAAGSIRIIHKSGTFGIINTTSLNSDHINNMIVVVSNTEADGIVVGKLIGVLGTALTGPIVAICESKHDPTNYGMCYISPKHPVFHSATNTITHPVNMKDQWNTVTTANVDIKTVPHIVSLAIRSLTDDELADIAPRVKASTGYNIEKWCDTAYTPLFNLYPLVEKEVESGLVSINPNTPTYRVAGLGHGNTDPTKIPPELKELAHPFYGKTTILQMICKMKHEIGRTDWNTPFLILEHSNYEYKVNTIRRADGYVIGHTITRNTSKVVSKRARSEERAMPNKATKLDIL